MFEGKGEEARNSCVVTADRGYNRESFLDVMTFHGLASTFVMPDHIVRAHPFVAASYLHPDRDRDGTGDDTDSEDDGEVVGDGVLASEDITTRLEGDRQNAFIVDDSAKLGQAVFMATKSLHSADIGQQPVTAVAVREHGTSKAAKVLRFMHAVPQTISNELDTWVAVPKTGVHTATTLYAGMKDALAKVC